MSLSDWERPLNKRGKRDAPVMGKRLAAAGIQVDVIMSSTAARAITTADLIAKELNFTHEIDQRDELYHAGENELLAAIRSVNEIFNIVMLVAHNPGMTDLVNRLSRHPIDNVPTGGIAMLKYDINSWTDIGKLAPVEFRFDYPKNTRSVF